MSEAIVFEIQGSEESGDEVMVELEGSKLAVVPDFVMKNRARIKAIRVVGIETLPRAAVEAVMEGDVSRFTEIVEYDKQRSDVPLEDVYVVVAVKDML